MHKKPWLMTSVCAAILGVSLTAVPAFAAKTLKLSGQHSPDHPATDALKRIKKKIESSDVGLKVRVFPASQLGDYTSVYKDVMRGSIGMAQVSLSTSLDEKFGVSYFPYLVTDYDEMRSVYSSGSCFYKRFKKMHGQYGVKLMGMVPEGFGQIATNKKVEKPYEAGVDKGVQIRVPPIDTFEQPIKTMGYRSTTIDYADLHSALESGVVDGWIGGTAALNSTMFSDVVSYVYPYREFVETTFYLVGKKTWKSLDDDQQKVVKKAFHSESKKAVARAEKQDKKYLEELKNNDDIEVVDFPSADAKKRFVEKVRSESWPKLEDKYGEDMMSCMRSLTN